MTRAIIFISYHPQYLVDYVNLCKIDGDRSQHILILCKHSYLSETIINEYSGRFDQTIVLPDTDYNKNLLAGFISYAKFKRACLAALEPVLRGIDSYCVISCCSAWFPVNALLTTLCCKPKFNSLFTVCEHTAVREGTDYLRTFLSFVYTSILRLHTTYYDKVHNYLYRTNPWNGALRFIGPYEKVSNSAARDEEQTICYIRRPARPRRDTDTGLVVFYSDRHLDVYKCSLSEEERHYRLRRFMRRLGKFYSSHTIVCKPHPLDKNMPIEEMHFVRFQPCDQSLLSQMHLQLNIDKVVACYSISSTSLLYSASIGVPSYCLFKYLGYGDDANVKNYFDNPKAQRSPYLYNLSTLEEIGKIDNINIEPIKSNNFENWDRIMYTNAVSHQEYQEEIE